MSDLDSLYIALLREGLISVRNAARSGDFEWCKAESEYLHEIPPLIGQTDLTCHVYQATGARKLYLKWIANNARHDVQKYVDMFYVPVWIQMDKLLGIDSFREADPKAEPR
jgi:hypothetical protein